MNAARRTEFVQVPLHQATEQQKTAGYRKINMTRQIRKEAGRSFRAHGYRFRMPSRWEFWRRFEAASVQSYLEGKCGWVDHLELNKMVTKHDGCAQERSPRMRSQIVSELVAASLAEKRRGAARVHPRLLPNIPVLVCPVAVDAHAIKERNDRTDTKKTAPKSKRAGAQTIYSHSSAVLAVGETLRDRRAANGQQQLRDCRGRFGNKWPENVPKEIPEEFIEQVERELEELERMPPSPPNQTQEQKTQGHDAERRIPTPVPAPTADGSADADQPIYKNLWKLVEHYQQNPAAAARVRSESAAEGGGTPRPAPRPRLVPVQASAPARPTQSSTRSVTARDDSHTADGTWLAFTLTRSKHLAPLLRSNLVKSGYNRGVWRASVGGLLARAPGTVDNPAGFIHGIMRSLVSGTERDPRTKPGYFPHEGWGRAALEFAGVQDWPAPR